eukprot:m.554251 g.554251  ORF g.554251 m.554251 type:complete len:248 (+) comp22176_c0_seq7:671-1414(+)
MSSRQQSSKRPAQPQPWHRPKSSPMKIAQAEAALSADGQTPDGRFMVWHQPSGAAVLTMCYKGKCTHHKIAPNEDGILTMNKKTFGLNATKLGQIVSALSKEPLPKGWPMRLSETVDPSGKVLKHPAKKSTTPATGAGSTKGSSTKSVTAKVSGGAAPPRPEKRDTKKESSAPKVVIGLSISNHARSYVLVLNTTAFLRRITPVPFKVWKGDTVYVPDATMQNIINLIEMLIFFFGVGHILSEHYTL